MCGLVRAWESDSSYPWLANPRVCVPGADIGGFGPAEAGLKRKANDQISKANAIDGA